MVFSPVSKIPSEKLGRPHLRRRAVLALLFATLLSGCAELPAIGPTIGEVEVKGASYSSDPFIIVDVDKQVVETLNSLKPLGFVGHLESRAPRPELRIAVGDTLQINIVEHPPGLFSAPLTPTLAPVTAPQTQPPMTLQPVQVGANGAIMVPWADRIIAAGRTPDSVAAEIQSKLENKAIFPQVQVMILSTTGVSANSATVGGEVNRAGVFTLQPAGNRLLDLVAQAGGARFPAYSTTVYLTRRGQRRQASLENIIENPAENVFIYPRDDIYLSREERTFSVMGASSKVGRYPFETAHVNLAEAVAIGGGFVDNSADPAGVYVFRYEPARLARTMKPESDISSDGPTPVLYRVNLRSGDGYFLSTKFQMHDKDVILLANSDGAQFQKLLNILQGATNLALTTKALTQQNSVVVTTLSNTASTPAAQ